MSHFIKQRYILITSFSLVFVFFIFNIITLSRNISPELKIGSLYDFNKEKASVVAASCGLSNAGHADADYEDCSYPCPDGSSIAGKKLCGGICSPRPATRNPVANCTSTVICGGPEAGCETYTNCTYACTPGYSGTASEVSVNTPNSCHDDNPQVCPSGDFCMAGIFPSVTYLNYYQAKPSNNFLYKNGTNPTPSYTTGSCPGGVPVNFIRKCEITRNTSDNSQTSSWSENYDSNHTIWANQPTKNYQYDESISVRCGYWNTLTNTYSTLSSWVTARAYIAHPNYEQPCGSTNSCGLSSSGTYDENGICSASPLAVTTCNKTNACGRVYAGTECTPGVCNTGLSDTEMNADCIKNFNATSDNINPNGTVEFTWKYPTTARPSCSFVDLTTGVARPIKGLENLSPTTDRVRITNIQATTRFCLICQFYSLIDNSYLGDTAIHQWVRVQKIGEN